MLVKLSIKNYAIINELEVRFHPQLNIITGETGAGKSILIGALNMILGKRADTTVLQDQSKKCSVEGTFDLSNLSLKSFFEENDLDYDMATHIRREIRPDGKSRAFINDTPVNLEMLRDLSVRLVDLHSQNETQALLDKQFYIHILDHLAQQTEKVKEFKKDFHQFISKKQRLRILQDTLSKLQFEKDYVEFQFNELNKMKLNSEDGEALEEELNKLENAEFIQETLASSIQLLENDEMSILELLGEFANKFKHISKFGNEFATLNERIETVSLELNDVQTELNRLSQNFSIDEERLSYLKDRSNEINRLLQKNRLSSVEDLLLLENELKTKLDSISFGEEDLKSLSEEVVRLEKELYIRAEHFSTNRQKQIPLFKLSVEEVLRKIGMPYSSILLEQKRATPAEMNSHGIDEFDLLFSANKGSEPLPLKKVASGGERSRLMLAIKSIIAGNATLPTLIFDEIDTGISGEIASKVGEVFKTLAVKHQLIAITHLPQIAAQANHHLYVYKDHSSEKTTTGIKVLGEEEKVIEIAKMLSGDQPGESALNTARELMN